MAIKGKSKTRTRRTISAAPRPTLVVRKPPIWRRPWVIAVASVVVLVGVAAGVLAAVHASAVHHRKQERHDAVLGFVSSSRAAFPQDRQAVPPDVVVIFPSVSTDLDAIGTSLDGTKLADRGKQIVQQATDASKKTQAINVNKLIPAKFPADRQTLTDARFLMAQAFAMYEQIGGLFEAASKVSGQAQKDIVTQARALVNQAGTIFDQGYRKVVHLADALGVQIQTSFSPAPTAPGPPVTTPPAATSSP